MNDLFVTKDSSPYIPRYVSCLVKHCGPAKSMLGYLDMSYCEVVGSRISNLLGVKTTYNISNQMFGNYIDKPVEWEDYYYNADSISVDFVPFGWDFENFRDMGARLNTYGNLQDTLEYVKVILGENASNLDINLSQENILQFEKDFCLQYLFRKLVVADCDYTSKNIGVLFNQTNGDFVLAPNFDLEMLFEYEYIRSSKLKQLTDESLIYFHSRFPNLLDSFMSKLEEGLSNGKIKDIMLNTFTNFANKKPDTTIKYYNDFEWNARIILDAYKSILNSSCPSNNLNDCQTM